MIIDVLDTNSTYTHMGIAYAHLTVSHISDYMGYVLHVGHVARSWKKSPVNT